MSVPSWERHPSTSMAAPLRRVLRKPAAETDVTGVLVLIFSAATAVTVASWTSNDDQVRGGPGHSVQQASPGFSQRAPRTCTARTLRAQE
jgi:hypothetical protein